MTHEGEDNKSVQLEISIEKLAYLFEIGAICAGEIRCLTADSKQQVSALCLSSCAKNITCNIAIFNEFSKAQPLALKKTLSVNEN